MSYEITATRRRPRRFSELKGQEFVVATLCNSIASQRIAPAYLFYGPRGVGKTSAARILAAALNVPEGASAENWSEYPGSREIAHGTSIDVIEIDGASNTGVNDIRAIKDQVLFPPTQLRYKIYIIDEVHMLSTSAFNALLKTIEEPPPYVIFIFATTEIHRIPATIRSRCQQFTFHLLKNEEIVEELIIAAKESNIQAEAQALLWIARESGGSLRDAYMLFDQIVAFGDAPLTEACIVQHLGLAMPEAVAQMVATTVQGDAANAFAQFDALMNAGMLPERFVGRLIEYFRALLFVKAGVKKSLYRSTIDTIPEGTVQALSMEQIEQGLRILFACHRNLRYTLNVRFEVELLLAELCQLRHYISSRALVEQAQALQRELPHGETSFSEEQAEQKELQKDAKESATRKVSEKSSASPSIMISDKTQQLIERIATKDTTLAQMLKQAVQWNIDDTMLKVVFATTFMQEQVHAKRRVIEETAKTLWGTVHVRIEHHHEKEVQEEEPAVEALKHILKGKIVEH